MSERIENASSVAFRMPSAPSRSGVEEARGNWHGEAVNVGPRDSHSLIEDAKEELAASRSEEMETKEIRERNIEEGTYGERVNEIEGAWKLLEEQIPDLDLGALRDLLDQLVASDASEEEIERMVSGRFHDPTHAFAALEMLEKALRSGGHQEIANRVGAVAERFSAANGAAIRAGLNVTAAAFEVAAGDRVAAGELRDLYRATVFGEAGPAGLYRGMINQFGVEGFSDRLRFLTRAAGDDLAAAGPSVDPVRLRELIGELSALRVLDTAHERCTTLTGRIERQSGISLRPTAVLQALLPLTEEAVNGPSKILALPQKLDMPATPIDATITLLRESREVMGMIPIAIYRDPDARGAVLRAMQEAMDIMVEREESA